MIVVKNERGPLGKRPGVDVARLYTVQKKAKRVNVAARIPRNPTLASSRKTGFPAKKTVSMRYATTSAILTSTTGALAEYIYRANSIFDPDLTAAGHQPMGHDQWQTFYEGYHVVSSKIYVVFQTSASVTTPPIVGISLLPAAPATATVNTTLIEQGMVSWAMLPQSGSVSPLVKLTNKFDAKSFFNVKDVKDVEEIGAAFGANPADLAYFVVWVQGHDLTTTVAVDIQVCIDFVVMLHDPKELPQS